ncbi:phosphoribosylglycinamide formyltransferase [Spiractinospora alimapuensis]|uniref:phosphoribosylglycinamide formyltransferase n=1 Tax=Spiractinospora alimapuensis TaxID=2820884 RepID=UPI0037448939
MRVVVLISGSGTNMEALLEATAESDYGVTIAAVGADRDASGLDRARAAGVPTFVCRLADHPDRAAWDEALSELLDTHAPDLVVSAGFMRLLGSAVLGRHTVLNIHPALLPAFPGAHAVRDALAYGVRYTGTTAHFVDEGVDTGPVIEQVPVAVHPDDDEASLHARIKVEERRMLVEVVRRLAAEGWRLEGRHAHYGGSVPQRAR